jgi:hypothetical protein
MPDAITFFGVFNMYLFGSPVDTTASCGAAILGLGRGCLSQSARGLRIATEFLCFGGLSLRLSYTVTMPLKAAPVASILRGGTGKTQNNWAVQTAAEVQIAEL